MRPINNTIAIVVLVLITTASAGALAQTARGPLLDDLTKQQTLVQSGGNCIGQVQVNCGPVPAPPACVQTLVQCSNTYVNCRNTGGVTAAWVMRKIKDALNNYATKAELEALRREMQAKDADLQAQIDALREDLKRNWDDHTKIRNEIKVVVKNQAVVDARQDERITALEKRVDALSRWARFEIGAEGILSSGIYGGAILAGLDVRGNDQLRILLEGGVGISSNKDVIFVAKGGPLWLLGEERNLGLGAAALYLKEGAEDNGRAFIGVGPQFKLWFAEHGYFSVNGGLGAATKMVPAPIAGFPDRTKRDFSFGWSLTVGIGGTF